MQNELKRLEGMRNMFRTIMMVFLLLELGAFVLIVTGQQMLGLILGCASMAGYFIVKNKGKNRFGDACAKVQAEVSLGLKDVAYEGRKPFDPNVMKACGMVSLALKVDAPLMRRALTATLEGVRLTMAEITFGVVYPGQNKHEFNSGTLITAPMAQPVEKPVLLLGHNSFRHKLIRSEYEESGWQLCPVGGKAKGWFVFTPDGVAPEQTLLDKLDALNRAAENRVAVSIKGSECMAFFMGAFYTDRFPLGDALIENDLKKKEFEHLPAFINLVK